MRSSRQAVTVSFACKIIKTALGFCGYSALEWCCTTFPLITHSLLGLVMPLLFPIFGIATHTTAYTTIIRIIHQKKQQNRFRAYPVAFQVSHLRQIQTIPSRASMRRSTVLFTYIVDRDSQVFDKRLDMRGQISTPPHFRNTPSYF